MRYTAVRTAIVLATSCLVAAYSGALGPRSIAHGQMVPPAPGSLPQGAPIAPVTMGPAGVVPMAPYGFPAVPMGNPMWVTPGSFPVQPATALGTDAGTACTEAAKGCDCGKPCCPGGGWCYRFSVFADFLYLRARDSEIAYAVEVNTAVPPPGVPVQVGRVGVADMDYEPNWRAGFNWVLDEASLVSVTYTMFEADTHSRTDLTSGLLGTEIQGLLFHPGTASAASGGISADANYFMSFDLIDADYKELIAYDCYYETNFLIGARYANLEQQLNSSVDINGSQSVQTDIDFDGVGARLGLESVRYSRRGFLAYGKVIGSLLVGNFSAKYDQRDQFDASVVDTAWKAGRMVPILDLELGVGWTSHNGYWRFSAGYLYSAWFNVVKTDEFIDAVQANNFVGLSDTITFDGLVARIESRF